MEIPPWYVITGTLVSGKDTIVNELAIRGYQIVPEATRILAVRYRARGIPKEDARRGERKFQRDVFNMKLEIEENLPRDRTIFLNRGVPDSISYYKACGMDPEEVERVSRNRYRKIFFLESLFYGVDYSRTRSPRKRMEIDMFLKQSYKDLGYDIVSIPNVPIEERLDLILSKL